MFLSGQGVLSHAYFSNLGGELQNLGKLAYVISKQFLTRFWYACPLYSENWQYDGNHKVHLVGQEYQDGQDAFQDGLTMY